MKRWIFWSIASVLTFLFGCAIVFAVSIIWKPATQDRQLPVLADGPVESKPDDLVPEFRDLPNIKDVDSPTLNAELVDTLEYENEYRDGEITAKSGEIWLGLFVGKGKFELRNEKVEVILHHKSIDPENGDWLRFKFKRQKNPIFLVRNTNLLNPGPVNSLYHRPSQGEITRRNLPIKSMDRGYKESYWLRDEEYTLRVTSGITRDNSEVNVLVLETGDSSQVVTYNSYFKDTNTNYNSIGDLLWVGDLDGDGKLDFYISEFGYEKGGFGSSLFLSSAAGKGQLVKLIASFGTSGC